MKLIKIIFIIFVIYFFNMNLVHSNEKVFFVNLDLLIKETNVGKLILKDIEKLNEKNISQLKKKENELKSLDNEIKKKTKYSIKR